MQAVEVNLPGGMPIHEQWCRAAWLQPATGYEEEFLSREGERLTPAERTTHLLSRCLRRLGPLEPVGKDIVRQLCVGDREALLLHLRRLTLGERISCVLSCPSCAERMDLDLQVSELLQPPYAHEARMHQAEIRDGEASYRASFRLPNGSDQEGAAVLAAESIASAVELVLGRCVESLTTDVNEKVSEFSPLVAEKLQEKMASLDPQAEILLDLSCPECQVSFVVPFDAADYVCRELTSRERDLYREVHALAFHYHWTEDAVLALPRRKRQIYMDLLADQLSQGGRGA